MVSNSSADNGVSVTSTIGHSSSLVRIRLLDVSRRLLCTIVHARWFIARGRQWRLHLRPIEELERGPRRIEDPDRALTPVVIPMEASVCVCLLLWRRESAVRSAIDKQHRNVHLEKGWLNRFLNFRASGQSTLFASTMHR